MDTIMDVMHHQQAARETKQLQANREELVERIGWAMCEDGTIQPLQGLYLSRSSLPLKPLHSVLKPSVCVIAQGSKEVLLGNGRYRSLFGTPPMRDIQRLREEAQNRAG